MNPELLRNLWLELTPQRLVAMPVILGLIVAILFVGNNAPGEVADAIAKVAQTGFILITAIWGASQASSGLQDELAQGTWDAQRASGLTAGQMLLGKMGGAASFAWYGGAWCLAVYVLAALAAGNADEVPRHLTGLLAVALLCQSIALLSSLMSWRKGRTARARQGRSGAAILLGLILLGAMSSWIEILSREAIDIDWYGLSIPDGDFVLASTVAFAAWALLGAHRVMRQELLFRSRPWSWLGFMVFLIAWTGGFIHGDDDAAQALPHNATPLIVHLLAGAGIAATATYAFLFYERKDSVQFMRLRDLASARRHDRLLELTPLWLVNFALACALAGAAAVTAAIQLRPMEAIAMTAGLACGLLFLARDVGIVLWTNLGPNQRRADAAALAYLLVLYLALPVLAGFASDGLLLGLFIPGPGFDQPVWVLAPLFQAAAVLDLVRRRWRELPQPTSAPAPTQSPTPIP